MQTCSMRLGLAIALLCLATAPSLVRGEEVRYEGQVYEDVIWGDANPSEVTIYHKSGVAKLRLELLSDRLKEQFGYDPEKAIAFEAERAREERERADKKKYYKLTSKQKVTEDQPPPPDVNLDENQFYLKRYQVGTIVGPFVCAEGEMVEYAGVKYEIINVREELFTLRSTKTKDVFGPFWLKDYANAVLGGTSFVVMRPSSVAKELAQRREEQDAITEAKINSLATAEVPELENKQGLFSEEKPGTTLTGIKKSTELELKSTRRRKSVSR